MQLVLCAKKPECHFTVYNAVIIVRIFTLCVYLCIYSGVLGPKHTYALNILFHLILFMHYVSLYSLEHYCYASY